MTKKKYIITVYAICKNEEKFVDRWWKSMREADNIVVLDTGSTDNSIKKLKSHGITVKSQIIYPWRFDVARNLSLNLVPKNTDICVCTDLDEVFEKNWRKKLEKTWQKNTNKLRYKYVWNKLNNKDGITFFYDKIHSLNNFKWIYPVHEVLCYTGNNNINILENNKIVLRHYPDKQKSRKNYLNLLKLSVKENPNNDRCLHYLAREFFFNKQYLKAIKFFKKHLNLKSSTWSEERSSSCSYIAQCYIQINKIDLAEKWFKKGIKECFNIREPYFQLANFYYYIKKDYFLTICTLNLMLKIKKRQFTYLSNPLCWNESVYELLSKSYYKQNQHFLAYKTELKANKINPNNKVIKNNLIKFSKIY